MPYFINVGRFTALKGIMGARGWHIWRRDKIVYVLYGPIEVRNGYPRRFIWARGPTLRKIPERTVEAAKKEMQQRIDEKQGEKRANGDGAYQRLPPGQRILPKQSGHR